MEDNLKDYVAKSALDSPESLIPKKSRACYEKVWRQFREDQNLQDGSIPTEQDYLEHFTKLREEKKLKASTLWSVYSRLNAFHTSLYGKIKFIYKWKAKNDSLFQEQL